MEAAEHHQGRVPLDRLARRGSPVFASLDPRAAHTPSPNPDPGHATRPLVCIRCRDLQLSRYGPSREAERIPRQVRYRQTLASRRRALPPGHRVQTHSCSAALVDARVEQSRRFPVVLRHLVRVLRAVGSCLLDKVEQDKVRVGLVLQRGWKCVRRRWVTRERPWVRTLLASEKPSSLTSLTKSSNEVNRLETSAILSTPLSNQAAEGPVSTGEPHDDLE